MKVPRARPSRWTPWLAAGGLLLMTAWFFPYFASLGSPNELTRIYLTRAIVDDGTFSIDGPVERYGRINDMAGHGDHLYSDKAPGVSFFSVPVYFIAKVFSGWDVDGVSNPGLLRWLRILLAGVPTAGIALMLFFLMGRLEVGRGQRFFLMAAHGLGTVAFPYGVLLFGHQLTAFFLVAAFVLIDRQARAPSSLTAVGTGVVLGCAVLTEYTSVLLVVPLAVHAVLSFPRRLQDTLLAAVGGLAPLALLFAYHSACFGGPFETGYAHLVHRSFADVHDRGLWGMVAPSFSRLFVVLGSPQKGLFFYSPWLLLALPALGISVARPRLARWRSGFIAICAASLLYLLFSMSLQLTAWGWSVGPRHLCPLVPFWVLAVGVLFKRPPPWPWWIQRVLRVLVPFSVVAIVLPVATFGGYPPDFDNPLADFSVQLLLGGCLSPSVGTSVGVSAGWAALPFWLALLTAIGWLAWSGSGGFLEKAVPAALAAALVALTLTVTGPPDPKEARALEWVQKDVLQCVEKTGWEPP